MRELNTLFWTMKFFAYDRMEDDMRLVDIAHIIQCTLVRITSTLQRKNAFGLGFPPQKSMIDTQKRGAMR